MSANEGFTPMAILAGVIMMSEWTHIYIYIGVFHGCPIYFRYQNTFGVRNGKRLATRMCTEGD